MNGNAGAACSADEAKYRPLKCILFVIALALLHFFPSVTFAGQDCMSGYYRAKSPACVDDTLAQLRQMAANGHAEPNTIIGFLAQLFKDSPQERERVLKAEPSDYVKSVDLISLYRAGLPDDAQKFATTNSIAARSDKLQATRLVPLDDLRPSSIPSDNDLLIGAYMASGNPTLIQRILDNYSSADDSMASDGFRMGLMMGKFGPTLTPKGRDNVTVQAACARYQCKVDQTRLPRVMTLATALWSLQSLARQDAVVNKTLSDFLTRDTRLKTLFSTEQAAFGNYLTALVIVTTFKDNQTAAGSDRAYAEMSKSASIYETLGSANEAFEPMKNLKK